MNHYNKKRGIMHILLAAFFFALMTFFVAKSGELPSLQKSFFRNAVAMIAAFIMLVKSKVGFHINTKDLPVFIARSTAGLIGIICNFYAISHINISDANMLNKLSPFFAILFSIIILKEKPNKIELGAVLVAFVGALFVIKPSFSMTAFPALMGAVGGLGAGIAYTCVRVLGNRGVHGKFIVFFFSTFSSVVLLPNLILNYHPMTIAQFGYLILAGLAATGGQLNITAAYIYAPAKEISIYDYSQILFAAILGFFFLGQMPDVYSFIGYAIIIGAALFRWFYQNKTMT